MKFLFLLFITLIPCAMLQAANPKESPESPYYKITSFTAPEGAALEVGSIELLPDHKLALGTRRGEVWIVSHADDPDPSKAEFKLFASGLHEILGLGWRDGWLYATIRYEVLRMKDEDGDGRADLFETVCDKWGVSGDYHEYAFGSPFDKDGYMWVTLCLTGSFSSQTDFRGWAMRITPDGKMIPTCSGVRSPGGIGFDADGNAYFTDNQGPWRGACTVQPLIPGTFVGHPGGNKWYALATNMGPRPPDPHDQSHIVTERARIKEFVPPAVQMTHGKIGNSSSFIACDQSGGKFGPFEKQLFVGDQSHSNVSRVYLETVNGVRQGVVFPFRLGFQSGLIGGRMKNETGHLFVGGSDRGWGAHGGKPFDFERLEWTGKVPFEVHEMHAKPDGFELTFTQPIDPTTAGDPKSYSMREFTYIYRAEYGGPEVEDIFPKITHIDVADDHKSVRLHVDKLTKGDIHEVHLDGVRSADGLPVLHPVGYYTLNEIPK